MELVGHGAQALGEQAQRLHLDRQLARLGLHQRALGAQDVAQVPALEGRIDLLAHGVARDVQLDAAVRGAQRSVLDGGKAGLAHDALEHHAAAQADLHGFGVQLLGALVGMGLLQRLGAVGGLEVVGEGHAALFTDLFAQGLEFFAALGDELVFVLGSGLVRCGWGVVFGHDNERQRKTPRGRKKAGGKKAGKAEKSQAQRAGGCRGGSKCHRQAPQLAG